MFFPISFYNGQSYYVNLTKDNSRGTAAEARSVLDMAKRTRRRRRSWSRLLLLVVFVAAALYAGYFCLFRPPEVPAETAPADQTETLSDQEDAESS